MLTGDGNIPGMQASDQECLRNNLLLEPAESHLNPGDISNPTNHREKKQRKWFLAPINNVRHPL
jgi:hypothetical protein